MPKRDGLGRGHAEKKKARIWLAIMAMFLLTNEQSLASRSTTISKDYGLRELSTTTRVTPRTLIGCGGGQRPIVNFLGPVRCPCFLHFVLGSSVDASWDVFFLPSSAFEQWELRGFAAEPSDYNLDYSFEGIRTSPASDSPTRELDESNVYVKGDYHLVFRAADDIERCFSKTSSYVFETMPSPCPVQTRIVGGSEPKNPESFKWIASIWFTNIKAVCGGSVIGPGYILTAAHCKIHESPSSFEVRIGGSTASSGKAFPVRRAWAHPDFRELSSGVALNDVAILEVDTSDEFNDDTSIAWNKDPSFPNTTSFVTAAGFGHISENWNALPVPNKLRRVDLPVVSVSKCATLYSSIDRDLHLCAGYLEGGCDSCQGDSGGPLYTVDPKNTSRYVLIGLVSFGTGCARKQAPGVYTRLSSYSEWINDTIVQRSATRSSPQKFGKWAIAGVSVGALIAVVLAAAIAVLAMKRRRKAPEREQQDEEEAHEPVMSRSRRPSTVPSMSGISN